jgi:hypothetical protein
VCVGVTSPTEFDTSPNKKKSSRIKREDTLSGHLIRNRMALSGLKRFHFISGFDCCVSSSEKINFQPIVCSCLKISLFFHHLRMYERAESTLSEKSRESFVYLYNMHSSSSSSCAYYMGIQSGVYICSSAYFFI